MDTGDNRLHEKDVAGMNKTTESPYFYWPIDGSRYSGALDALRMQIIDCIQGQNALPIADIVMTLPLRSPDVPTALEWGEVSITGEKFECIATESLRYEQRSLVVDLHEPIHGRATIENDEVQLDFDPDIGIEIPRLNMIFAKEGWASRAIAPEVRFRRGLRGGSRRSRRRRGVCF